MKSIASREEIDPDGSGAEAAADARRQGVKPDSEYCEPGATKQTRPERNPAF
jgi:hypothetical protein